MNTKDRRTVQIFVPGIMQFPNDSHNWDGRAQTWVNLNGEAMAHHHESVTVADRADYFCGPIGRAFFQQRRVDRVIHVLKPYVDKGFSISVSAHSNGTDLILKALGLMDWPRVDALHLISGACKASFDKNGLNKAIKAQRVGRVFVYVAGKDMALRLAKGWLGKLLGYGTLGLHGPKHVLPELLMSRRGLFPRAEARVVVRKETEFGHSTWFGEGEFDRTMRDCRRL
jgi:hypothetical protein